nr:NAD(P)H-dependent oxidoreductase [Aquabacterium terrae]
MILAGSPRPGSESLRVAQVMQRFLDDQGGIAPQLLDLAQLDLPKWEDEAADHETLALNTLREAADSADALVIVVPEWGGMAPPALKAALLALTNGEVAHKPVLLIAVSAGIGGSYPIAELRASCTKNAHLVFIPDHLIVRHVEQQFPAHPGDKTADHQRLELRVKSSLSQLITYARALAPVRPTLARALKAYPYGH